VTLASDNREFDVREALKSEGSVSTIEIYVGWQSNPISVVGRRGMMDVQTWTIAQPLLESRVRSAINPLVATGWELLGSFSVAVRWDMTRGAGGDMYEGCWVRLGRQPAGRSKE
jgi:hypothetical protein